MAFTLLAGSAIIQNKRVLLVQQPQNGDQANRWGPPAGHAKDQENLIKTAIRETKEETGLKVKITGLVQVGFFELKGKNYILTMYRAEIVGKAKIELDENEAVDFAWASLNDIQRNRFPLRKKFLKKPLILALKGQSSPLNTLEKFL